MNRITGRSAFLALLKDEGITHLFGNPGTTELPIMHALKEHPDLTYVLGLQESLVVAMADGYSRASGKLVACNVHVAPGLGNAMGSLFNAKFTGTPMILTAGQQEQGHGLTEPLLYDPLVPIAEPLVKWAVEVTRLEDLPRIVRRAAKVAMTPPTGPVFISLPGDILNAEAGIELGASTRVDTALAARRCRARQARQAAAARPSARSSSSATRSSRAMRWRRRPPSPRRWARPSTSRARPTARISSPSMPATWARSRATRSRCAALLSKYDLLVVLGADPVRMSVWSEVEPLPDDLPVVHIGLVDWDMGKNFAGRDGRARRRARDAAGADAGAREAGRRAPGGAGQGIARRAREEQLDGQARGPRGDASRARAKRNADRPGLAHPADRQGAAARRRGRQREPHRRPAPDRPRALSRPLRLPRAGLGRHRLGRCRRRSAWRWRRRRGRCAASRATAAPCTRSSRCGRRRT